jgi:hypothetical protein
MSIELAAEGPRDDNQASSGLRFMSAAELRASAPQEPVWIVPGLVAEGNITMFAGKPKVGKSRFSLDLTNAVATGQTFLGRRVASDPVVYVSEEGAATLAHKLPHTERVRVLTRETAWPKPDWPTLVTAAADEALRIGGKLLVIDTLAYWAGMASVRRTPARRLLSWKQS